MGADMNKAACGLGLRDLCPMGNGFVSEYVTIPCYCCIVKSKVFLHNIPSIIDNAISNFPSVSSGVWTEVSITFIRLSRSNQDIITNKYMTVVLLNNSINIRLLRAM